MNTDEHGWTQIEFYKQMNAPKHILNSIYWHDGHLDAIRFSTKDGQASISLSMRVYDDHQAPERDFIGLRFKDIVSWQMSCDANEIFSSRFAGEISNGYLTLCKAERKRGISTFRLLLCDGYIEINAKDIEIDRTSASKAPKQIEQASHDLTINLNMEYLDSVYWPNGILGDMDFSFLDSASIALNAKLHKDYPSMKDKKPKRNTHTVKFSDVASWKLSCDVNELLENKPSGNISNGYFKVCKKERKRGIYTLCLFLCFGYLEINSTGIEISKKTKPR